MYLTRTLSSFSLEKNYAMNEMITSAQMRYRRNQALFEPFFSSSTLPECLRRHYVCPVSSAPAKDTYGTRLLELFHRKVNRKKETCELALGHYFSKEELEQVSLHFAQVEKVRVAVRSVERSGNCFLVVELR